MTLLMAMGCPGELLLEDANDIIDMMEWSRRVVPRGRWVEERRMDAEKQSMMNAFGL